MSVTMLMRFSRWVSSAFKLGEQSPDLVRSALLWKILLPIGLFLALVLPLSVNAAPLHDIPQTVVQPDGEVIHCFASGDEFYNWLHDKDGFVIIRDPGTGFLVYAREQDGDIVPSEYVVGRVDPREAGLEPDIMPSPEVLQGRIAARLGESREVLSSSIESATHTGSVNNIVVFVRFSDEDEFDEELSTYDDMFNDDTAGANSMHNYFYEVSYNQLTVSTTLYPTTAGSTVVSYQDSHPRRYYQPYNQTTNPDGYTNDNVGREHALLRNAVDAISSQVPADLNLDSDTTGRWTMSVS